MGIHQIFAHNLRAKCVSFSSIAEACRTIGVNRQQFNKYLSGAMLPNARTLQRICKTLGLEEWELFTPEDVRSAQLSKDIEPVSSAPPSIFQTLAGNKTFAKLLATNKEAGITPGVYTCYFPLHGVMGCLVASTVCISAGKDFITFTRHTRIHSPSSKQQVLATGKHQGFVLSNGTYDYLIGYNTVSPNNLTFKCFTRDVLGGEDLRVGVAMIQGVNPLIACRVAMKKIGTSPRHKKEALKENSNLLYARTDFEKSLVSILQTPPDEDRALLTMFSLNTLLFDPRLKADVHQSS